MRFAVVFRLVRMGSKLFTIYVKEQHRSKKEFFMNKSNVFFMGLLAVILAMGLVFVGCDNSTTNDNENGESLPPPKGTNAVSGKIYYEKSTRTVFSITDDGASNGTYTVGEIVYNRETGNHELVNGKYKYADDETGTYTWNEEAKTVTLKPYKKSGPDGGMLDKAGYKTVYTSYMNDMVASTKEEYGWTQAQVDAYIKEQLASMGYSSMTQYIDATVNEAFSNKTNAYSFSTDGTALFLEEALPANKGTNQFSGQTYYGLTYNYDFVTGTQTTEKDTNQVYVFTATGYTFTDFRWGTQTETGSYAYDSNLKRVWLRPSTKNGENKDACYTEQTAYSGHYFADDNAYRAMRTNELFCINVEPYNSTNKTIGEY